MSKLLACYAGREQPLPDWARACTPPVIDSMDAVRRWIDGYDVADPVM